MSIKFIRLAHEMGLGAGEMNDIEIVGEDISDIDWKMEARKTPSPARARSSSIGAPQAAGEFSAQVAHRPLVVCRFKPLSQHLLDALYRTSSHPRRDEDRMGTLFQQY